MKSIFAASVVACFILLLAATGASALTGEEIIRKMEANQVHKTSVSTGSMAITDRFGTRSKTYKAYARGQNEMLLEFTNPEEAGQKILRIGDDIYLYFPEAEEIIHLQGAALKDSVMGSDFSYEDLTGGKGLLESYHVTLESNESIDGHDCYLIKLEARTRDVVYPIERVWVDTELLAYRKVILYSLREKPIKEMLITDFERVAGKNVPVRMEMRDLMKKNSKTVFETRSIDINIPLDDNLFSLAELSW